VKIGILALQGDFFEHYKVLQSIGVTPHLVKLPDDLTGLSGLIIPGGESTTIGKLATEFGLMTPLRQFGREHAIWGTCAGAIFISKDAMDNLPLLNLMDIQVKRNAFGRQVDVKLIVLRQTYRSPFLRVGRKIYFMLCLSVPQLSNLSMEMHRHY